jgi:hypothetical protein
LVRPRPAYTRRCGKALSDASTLIGDAFHQSRATRFAAYARSIEFALCLHQVSTVFQTPCQPNPDNAAATFDRLIRSMEPCQLVDFSNGGV